VFIFESDLTTVLTARLTHHCDINTLTGVRFVFLERGYTSLNSVEWKRYSGVTDDAFKCTDEKLAALGITRPKYEELTIVFLPEVKTAFIDLVARIEASKKAQVLVGELATFNALFDAIVRVKQDKKVINNAVALRLLAQLAVSALDAEKVVSEAAAATARKVA
jgi:hypothetical protein